MDKITDLQQIQELLDTIAEKEIVTTISLKCNTL